MLADFAWTKPTVGGSSGTWGTELNAILDILVAHPGIKVVADATAKAAYTPLLGQLILQADTGVIYKCTNSTGPVWAQIDTVTGVMTTEGDILYQGASAPARLAKGTAKQVLRMNAGATAPEYVANTRGISFSIAGNLSAGKKVRIPVPVGLKITGGKVWVGTVPVGADLVLDLHKITDSDQTGTSVYTTQANRPKIADGATNKYASITVPDVDSIAAGECWELVVDTIGNTTSGADLGICFYCEVA